MHWNETSTTDEKSTKPAEVSPQKEHATRSREVLVMGRDPELKIFLNKALFAGNLSYTSASTTKEALACLRKNAYGVFLVGVDSPDSLEFVTLTRREFPDVPVVGMARAATPELVRDVLQTGATDFFFGSLDVRTFGSRLSGIMGQEGAAGASACKAQKASGAIRERESSPLDDYAIICCNKKMKRILEIAETIAPTDSTVLVQGESGTGKELIAKRIHILSKRSDKPFVEVNCGALPENLLESQLFGHEKGSFTGAVHRQVGLFEIADQGTIFLDEIGEMSLDMQVKLLRVLQFKEFRRIGGSQVVRVDVRVIAATNKDLKEELEKKRFRPDLFYRLNVITLQIPPLRERLEEVPHLVESFAERFATEKGIPKKTFSPAAIEKLQKCRWTGNVRELENVVERSILLSKGESVDVADLDEYLGESAELSHESSFAPTLSLDEVKRIHIANVLRQNAGNKMKTARILRINVKTLYNLIHRLDIKETP